MRYFALDFETGNASPLSACALGVSVFEDGRLVGWGNPFYTQYRIEKKKGGKKLEL